MNGKQSGVMDLSHSSQGSAASQKMKASGEKQKWLPGTAAAGAGSEREMVLFNGQFFSEQHF